MELQQYDVVVNIKYVIYLFIMLYDIIFNLRCATENYI